MRLSEIKGPRCIDVIADISEPVLNIAMDDDAVEMFKPKPLPDGEDPAKFAMARAKAALPKLLRGHRDDLISIMAALDGKTPDEYAEEMTMASLLKGLFEVFTDEDLLAFLS